MIDSRLLVAGLAVLAGIGVAIVGTSPPTQASSTSDCTDPEPGAADTARLDASVLPAEVLDTHVLNGTIGDIHLENLPDDHTDYILRTPGGDETQKLNPFDYRGTYTNVSLCQTGEWDIINNNTGELETTFNVTNDKSEAFGDSYVYSGGDANGDVIEHHYRAGDAAADVYDWDGRDKDITTFVDWDGTIEPTGYSTSEEDVRVSMDWAFYVEDSRPGGYIKFRVCTYTEYQFLLDSNPNYQKCNSETHKLYTYDECTEVDPCYREGNVTVDTEWKAGGYYDTTLYVEVGHGLVELPYDLLVDSDASKTRTVHPLI